MALSKHPPNTILLGGGLPGGQGGHTIVNEYVAGVQITPGMLIEQYIDTGKIKLRPQASATAVSGAAVALEKMIHNKGVDDPYHVGELVLYAELRKGSSFWGLLPSGQDASANNGLLQSNGDGMLKAATAITAAANVAGYQALEVIGPVTVTTRIRVKVL